MDGITTTRLGDIYVRREADIVKVRDRVRRLARELGFDQTTQIKITTAVSELTRNIYEYAGSGAITLSAAQSGPAATGLHVTARDNGPGIEARTVESIMRGDFRSAHGLGVGLAGTRRLMDDFEIESGEGGAGTRVSIVKWLPPAEAARARARLEELREGFAAVTDESALEELQQQNRDLAAVLGELEEKREELERLNRALGEKNVELEEANAKLHELAEMKEEFLALTTHDLRSPLTVISGVISFFSSGRLGELTPEQQNMVGMMERNTQSLIELVNDLLESAKLDSGSIKLALAPVEPGPVLDEIRESMHALAAEKGIALEREGGGGGDDDLPRVAADRPKLRRALVNLVSNALKFTGRGGSVRLAASREGALVRFSVADTGVGIPPADLPRLFDKYEQGRSRATRSEKGTGLGLYITRQLVELHGGAIRAESQVGQGSTFSFTIPVADVG